MSRRQSSPGRSPASPSMYPKLCDCTLRVSGKLLRAIFVFGLAPVLLPLASVAESAWKAVAAGELSETKPKSEAEAPAEGLFWTIEGDDRAFPRERIIREHIRYKVFNPQKVEGITRVSDVSFTGVENRNELSARLTLPDGRTSSSAKKH